MEAENYQSWESIFSFFKSPEFLKNHCKFGLVVSSKFSYFGRWSILIDIFQSGWNYHLKILRIFRRAWTDMLERTVPKQNVAVSLPAKPNGFAYQTGFFLSENRSARRRWCIQSSLRPAWCTRFMVWQGGFDGSTLSGEICFWADFLVGFYLFFQGLLDKLVPA